MWNNGENGIKITEGSWFSASFSMQLSYKEISVEMNILMEILFTISYNDKAVMLD